MPEVLQFIEDIITKGFAYQVDDENIFFDVEKYISDSRFHL
jgi:cysteinyl-tRNA synthetase